MITYEEAKELGREKLGIEPKMFKLATEVAVEMGVAREHMGPMTLCIALLSITKTFNAEDEELQGEMTDAMALISKAETEWRMEKLAGRGHA